MVLEVTQLFYDSVLFTDFEDITIYFIDYALSRHATTIDHIIMGGAYV